MANLRLDVHEGAIEKRPNGIPVVPGKPDESLLIKRIYSDNPNFRMPPVFAHKTLTAEQKDILKRWIEQGAVWKQHWAFIPPDKPAAPAVKDSAWPRNDIDRFVLAKLESAGLQPAKEADRRTLIRRVTLDLTGLPPSPAEVEAFFKDKTPNAYEKVVDRLLASPRYGEHRARYWLDAARYADTQGLHFDNYREMWSYRDWVIKAFNRNMPFDRFTVEQLGGDLLPNATLDQKIASGFQRCNVTTNEGGVIEPEVQAIYAKDRADTTGTVWMGLTVGCATCHDHKFDPISQKDYYSLTSFFRNTTQPTMDMNIQDTPPTVYVPPAADRVRWDDLIARREKLREELAAAQGKSNIADVQKWLASQSSVPEIHRWPGESCRLVKAKADDGIEVESAGAPARIALPSGVTLINPQETDSKSLRFNKGATLTVPNVSKIDSAVPFTVATWIFIPKSKEDLTVVSQFDTLPGKGDAKTRRGWRITLDSGNLGIYSKAPALYLMSEDGTSISTRAIPDVHFEQDAWYHIVFSYDGSRRQRGFTMYVNSKPVMTIDRVDDSPLLTASIRPQAPIIFGGDEKRGFEGGAVSDFRILNQTVDPEDAKLLYLSTRVEAAKQKGAESLTPSEQEAATSFYGLTADPSTSKTVAQLRETDGQWEAIRTRSATTFVMQERTETQPVAHVLYRGQYDQMRDEVGPKTLGVLPPMTKAMPPNRLGLAMWLVDPSNPLTARVTVNRFWQEIFGNGIIKTVEDFGSQGEPATHPELLDWLAVDFRDSGWDVKRYFKMIVMSATYRQAANTTPEKIARDPENRLLAHGPRFRMDAEMVRDYALCASGLLRPEIGGPSVKPYQPSNIWETVAMDQSNTRVYKQDSGDALYRRSLYTFWKRAAPPPSLDIFNAPSRETCTVRRERTDTPLQALVTMNDKQFVEAARVLAQNALEHNRQFKGAAEFMAARLLSRPLEQEELAILGKSYEDFLAYYKTKPTDASALLQVGESKPDSRMASPKLAAMTMVANEMLNLDEVLVK